MKAVSRVAGCCLLEGGWFIVCVSTCVCARVCVFLVLRDHRDRKVHREQEEKKATLDPGSVSISKLVFTSKILPKNIFDFQLNDVSQTLKDGPQQ